MDLALLIFNIGVGIGALLIGLSLLVLVVSLRRLSRDARTLAGDVRRLNRSLERLVGPDEQMAEDYPMQEERQSDDAWEEAWEASPADPQAGAPDDAEELVGWWPGREPEGPVQSVNQREDERFA